MADDTDEARQLLQRLRQLCHRMEFMPDQQGNVVTVLGLVQQNLGIVDRAISLYETAPRA